MGTFSRRVVYFISAALILGVIYCAEVYGYVQIKFRRMQVVSAPVFLDHPVQVDARPLWFLHKINSSARAQRKENHFDGYEVDLWVKDGKIYVAHDEKELKKKITFSEILESLSRPEDKFWWLDLKMPMGETELDAILQETARFRIPPDHLFFEAYIGKTATLIKEKKLQLLLQLPSGFSQEEKDPAARSELNKKLTALIRQYEPVAISASFGKYRLLRAYFPDLPKAIYYSSAKSQRLKKYFMRKQFEKDPSVKIFMLEEYTYL